MMRKSKDELTQIDSTTTPQKPVVQVNKCSEEQHNDEDNLSVKEGDVMYIKDRSHGNILENKSMDVVVKEGDCVYLEDKNKDEVINFDIEKGVISIGETDVKKCELKINNNSGEENVKRVKIEKEIFSASEVKQSSELNIEDLNTEKINIKKEKTIQSDIKKEKSTKTHEETIKDKIQEIHTNIINDIDRHRSIDNSSVIESVSPTSNPVNKDKNNFNGLFNTIKDVNTNEANAQDSDFSIEILKTFIGAMEDKLARGEDIIKIVDPSKMLLWPHNSESVNKNNAINDNETRGNEISKEKINKSDEIKGIKIDEKDSKENVSKEDEKSMECDFLHTTYKIKKNKPTKENESIKIEGQYFSEKCYLYKFVDGMWTDRGPGNIILSKYEHKDRNGKKPDLCSAEENDSGEKDNSSEQEEHTKLNQEVSTENKHEIVREKKRVTFIRLNINLLSFDFVGNYDMKADLNGKKVTFYVLGDQNGVFCCRFKNEKLASNFYDLIK